MCLQNAQNSIVLTGFQRVERRILRVRVLHLRFIEQIGVHAVQKRQHNLLAVHLAGIKHRLHLCARVKIDAAFDVGIKRQKCAVCHTLLHIREKRGRTSRVRGVRRQNERVGPPPASISAQISSIFASRSASSLGNAINSTGTRRRGIRKSP